MNQRMIASLFILIAATGCGQNIAPSPVQPTHTPTPLPVAGAIAGRVIDAVTRDPIAGANVSTDPPTSTITTGANGGYTLTDILPGAYTVIAIGEGNIRADAQVTVKAGRLTLADIQLKRTDSTATDAAETHRDVFWPSPPISSLPLYPYFRPTTVRFRATLATINGTSICPREDCHLHAPAHHRPACPACRDTTIDPPLLPGRGSPSAH